jgi:hypothetical protein
MALTILIASPRCFGSYRFQSAHEERCPKHICYLRQLFVDLGQNKLTSRRRGGDFCRGAWGRSWPISEAPEANLRVRLPRVQRPLGANCDCKTQGLRWIPRAIVSEIIAGVRTCSRIDPLGIKADSATMAWRRTEARRSGEPSINEYAVRSGMVA